MAPDGPSTQAAISSDVSPSLFQADFTRRRNQPL